MIFEVCLSRGFYLHDRRHYDIWTAICNNFHIVETRKIRMTSNKNTSATNRLKQDYLRLKADPVPYIVAEPLPSNILEWHYVVKGPEQSPYEGGYYHGKLIFPRDFPFRPPSIYMITPNGRFKTNTRLCLSMSDFHPDTWNPAWSVSTILTGLLSFMLEKTATMGSIDSSDNAKKAFASDSLKFNLKNKLFCELFPDMDSEIKQELERRKTSCENQIVQENQNGSLPNAESPYFDQSHFYTALKNIFVIVCVTIFAFVVNYVLKSL